MKGTSTTERTSTKDARTKKPDALSDKVTSRKYKVSDKQRSERTRLEEGTPAAHYTERRGVLDDLEKVAQPMMRKTTNTETGHPLEIWMVRWPEVNSPRIFIAEARPLQGMVPIAGPFRNIDTAIKVFNEIEATKGAWAIPIKSKQKSNYNTWDKREAQSDDYGNR